MITEVHLGPTHCRYCKGRLPSSDKYVDLDGKRVFLRKPGRPRLTCLSIECDRAANRERQRRYMARKALQA